MSEELNTAPVAEPVVNQTESNETASETATDPYESQAREQGWKPKEEYEGEETKWRPAKEFVELCDCVEEYATLEGHCVLPSWASVDCALASCICWDAFLLTMD